MKRALPRKALIGTIVFALLLFVATGAMTQSVITGSKHDFSGQGWSGGEICVVCHTPHNSDTSVSDAPLWNHEVTTAEFTLYSSVTLDSVVGQPDGRSKLCLSCHDGTVALDSFGGNTGSTLISEPGDLGTDLPNDHPISFTYDAALAVSDGFLYNPISAPSSLGGTIDEDMLFGGKLECSSCHDAHDKTITPFLRISNAGSGLCMTCHSK